MGTGFRQLLLPRDRDTISEVYSDFSPEQPVQKYELRLPNAEGEERWIQWAIRAFFDPSGNVAEFQASGRDVTERKMLEREILDVSARERRHIGQDLHDGLGSHLSGVTMLCRGVIRKIQAGEDIEVEVMEEIAQLVQESIKQVRKLARGLNPVKMEDEGLPSALQELVSTTKKHPDITATFSCSDDVPDPDSEVALQLYRIAQEAVNNALKHADATQIDVHLGTKSDTLLLTVTDNGVGFSPQPEPSSGMGLRVMKYRANTIGAQLRIRRRESGGTLVQCALPLTKLHSAPRPQSTSP
jgi:signal transduction histidine kinase